MAINKKLIHFKNKENFDNEVAKGNILDNSIVFIQNTKEISTHGTIYKTVNWSVLEPKEILTFYIQDTYTNETFGPYSFEEGMTVEEFYNSEYNNGKYILEWG